MTKPIEQKNLADIRKMFHQIGCLDGLNLSITRRQERELSKHALNRGALQDWVSGKRAPSLRSLLKALEILHPGHVAARVSVAFEQLPERTYSCHPMYAIDRQGLSQAACNIADAIELAHGRDLTASEVVAHNAFVLSLIAMDIEPGWMEAGLSSGARPAARRTQGTEEGKLISYLRDSTHKDLRVSRTAYMETVRDIRLFETEATLETPLDCNWTK